MAQFCENCGAALSDDSNYCGNCGMAVKKDLPRHGKNCGATISNDMNFCRDCGVSVNDNQNVGNDQIKVACDDKENCGGSVVVAHAEENESTQPVESKSKFTGGAFGNAFRNFLVLFVSNITLWLAFPAMMCWRMRWVARHTYIDGKRLKFDGKGSQLFGKFLLWMFLSFITIGIYYFWCVPLALEKWRTKHTHYEDWTGDDERISEFDGNALQLFGVNLLARFVTVITLFFGLYWAHCYKERWYCKHTVIDGDRLMFDGQAVQYFGKRILWTFLTFITLGIYSFWLAINSKKWTVYHTRVKTDLAQDDILNQPTKKLNSLSLISFIASIIAPFIGMNSMGVFIAFLFPIATLVMNIVGMKQCKMKNERGKGFAIAGIVISSILTVVMLSLTIYTIVYLFRT